MRRAARRSSRRSTTGSAPAGISPKASPRSGSSASRIIRSSPHPNPPPQAGEGADRGAPNNPPSLAEEGGARAGGVGGWGLAAPEAGLSGLIVGEDDRRDEGPGLDEGGLVGLAAERLHRAEEAEPVQDLVLAAFFDLVGRIAVPGGIIAFFQRIVEKTVGGDVGPQLGVLLGEERVRPGGRGDKGRAPWA